MYLFAVSLMSKYSNLVIPRRRIINYFYVINLPYSSTLGRARQRRRFVQIVATVARHARPMYSHIEPRSLSTNLRRAERPCGGCWGCSPQRCLLDAVSNRTLVSPTAMWSSCGSTKSCPCSTAYARHRACGRSSYVTRLNEHVARRCRAIRRCPK